MAKGCREVSIPQAVSTVATFDVHLAKRQITLDGFNTASGKYCCNYDVILCNPSLVEVSIPQAVSTVATKDEIKLSREQRTSFNTASGKYCCNAMLFVLTFWECVGFNTASGKYCCNCVKITQPIAHLSTIRVSIPQAVSTVATK